MSLWTRILDALEALSRGEGFTAALERLSTPPEKTVAFAMAVIGLGAKMAKADGTVTRDEVMAFREVFHIPPEEEANAARIYNLARQDVAGYEAYAQKIARMFRSDTQVLEDLLEGLFHIATIDGQYHDAEDLFLSTVAATFGLSQRKFNTIRARYVPDAMPDPYSVLGVDPDDDPDVIRARFRALVRENHPDQMIARGVPEEAVKLADTRLKAINAAWEAVRRDLAA